MPALDPTPRCPSADGLPSLIGHSLLALSARLSLAAIFFNSGRTKVTGLLSVSDSAVSLFEEEYRLPLIDPTVAAHLATYAEHLFPLMLAFGLGTRLSAAALLGMTAVIEIFVYPAALPTHLSWATLLIYLLRHGGGRWSVDHAVATLAPWRRFLSRHCA